MILKKIKLINWHIFTNETIELSGNTLITGENGSGKSTLMDAIYFILSGGDKYHFNKAANEGGQRTLESYVRGKLGSEKTPYLRMQNDVIGYIILEYFDEKTKRTMLLGCNIEIVSQSTLKTRFFVVNNYKISDDDYIENKNIIDFKTLKSKFKAMKLDFDELPEQQRDRRRKIGRDIFKLENYNRFFDLLQNAISFKPISEVSTFVNSFLLVEDNVNLDSLREEIRSYQNIHKLLQKEKEKMDTLKEFVPKAEKYLKNLNNIRYLNTLKINLKIENFKYKLNRNNIELERLKDENNKLCEAEKILRENLSRVSLELYQLKNNEGYKVLLNKKERLKSYEKTLKEYNEKLRMFLDCVNLEQKIVRRLDLKYRFDADVKQKDFGILKAHFENYKEEIKELSEKLRNAIAKLEAKIESNNEQISQKKVELNNLKKGINNYPVDVINLMEIAKSAIMSVNPHEKNPEVKPLCEFIEIIDRKWASALEGYLNTQRFNLIFNPKYFDAVSAAFEQYKQNRKVFVSGIVNVSDIPSINELKNSMMYKIEIKNKWARKYASYLLGNLVCVENVKELKKYNSSITPSVMIYKNYVLKACNPDIYNTPFIGRESIQIRMNIIEKLLANLDAENKDLNIKIEQCAELLEIIKESKIQELCNFENYWLKIEVLEKEVLSLKEEITEDEKNKGILEITLSIQNAESREQTLNTNIQHTEIKKRNNNEQQGQVKQKISDIELNLEQSLAEFNIALKNIDKDKYNKMFNDYTTDGSLDSNKINDAFESIQKYNNAVSSSLITVMQKYSNNYKPSLSPLLENLQDYINEYYNLENQGVGKYEEEAKEAYERAESSFREDFISKLREKIEKSQKILDNINKNLALHPFGNDEEIYKFYYEPTKDSEFYNYYKVIMSGKLLNSKDLFTEILDEKDNAFIMDLFNKISMEPNNSDAEKELQRYLDYRNYMNYDIKITNKYQDVSYFSKINREKSGGETQTPFYIVIASCFNELMNKDINKNTSTCQVVFDEAFNNMDESRIKSLMEFYKQLNIQIIIIVPSNRISAISPYMDTLIGIMKENNHPYIIPVYNCNR